MCLVVRFVGNYAESNVARLRALAGQVPKSSVMFEMPLWIRSTVWGPANILLSNVTSLPASTCHCALLQTWASKFDQCVLVDVVLSWERCL